MVRNGKKDRDYLIVEIGWNTLTSPGDLWEICCHPDVSESLPAKAGVKKLQIIIIIIIIIITILG